MDLQEISANGSLPRTSRREVFDRMDGAQAAVGRHERERLRAILECDRRDLWRDQGCRDHAEFLAGRYHVSKWKARRWIGAAYALEHLPLTAHALESGNLSLDKVVELSRFATPATEKKLVSWARRVTTGGVRERADAETRLSVVAEQEADRDRYLRWWEDGVGLEIEGRLPPKEGAAFVAAIDRLAKDLPIPPPAEEGELDLAVSIDTIGERRADALALLCSTRIARDQDPDRARVVIHAPYEALMGDGPSASIVGGRSVQSRTVQRLACDGCLEVVLYHEDKIVGIGQASREPTRWLRRAVLKRDGHTCAFPGCEMKRFLHTHHMQWWEFDGPTDLDNLITLCHFHHKLVHEYGWSVMLQDDKPVWFRPSGRRHEPGPAPPESPGPEPEETRSPSTAPWAAMWHALQNGDYLLTQDQAMKRLLRLGAKRIDLGRLTHGDLHILRTGDDEESFLHAH